MILNAEDLEKFEVVTTPMWTDVMTAWAATGAFTIAVIFGLFELGRNRRQSIREQPLRVTAWVERTPSVWNLHVANNSNEAILDVRYKNKKSVRVDRVIPPMTPRQYMIAVNAVVHDGASGTDLVPVEITFICQGQRWKRSASGRLRAIDRFRRSAMPDFTEVEILKPQSELDELNMVIIPNNDSPERS